MEEDAPASNILKEGTDHESLTDDAKRFLQSVSRAYYPDFTTSLEDTYYSYEVFPVQPL